MKKLAILLALILLLLISGIAFAVAYIHWQEVNISVTLVPGVQGIEVVPATFAFGEVAVGEWSEAKPITIKNLTVTETWTTVYMETTVPAGFGVYLNVAPFTPIPPGGQLLATLLVRSEPSFATGPYNFKAKVIGKQ